MKKNLPLGIKLVIAFLIFLMVSPFVFTPLYEFGKAAHYASHMPKMRQSIIEMAQEYGQRIAPNDYEAMGRFVAWPRVKAQLPLLTINALILLSLAFGLFHLKNGARLGLIVYSFLIIFLNVWSMKELYSLEVTYPSILYGSFNSFGLGACLIYLIGCRNYFKKVL